MLNVCSGDLEHARLPRIPPPHAIVHPTIHRGRFLHQRRRGYLGVCRTVRDNICGTIPQSDLRSRYEKRKRRDDSSVATYHFVGYSSLYPFYCYPERVRMRLRYVHLSTLPSSPHTNPSPLPANSSSFRPTSATPTAPSSIAPSTTTSSPSPRSPSSPSRTPRRRSRTCAM